MIILVLEDEKRAAEKLIDLIESLGVAQTIHWKRSIKEGLDFLKNHPAPDLIYSDIQLLDGNVFDLYQRHSVPSPIIFCTAYDRFFMHAFKSNGIAYLLKPYTKEQFLEAWEKYQRLFSNSTTAPLSPKLLENLQLLLQKEAKPYKKLFTVKKADGVFLLKTPDIVYFQAQGDFVVAFDQQHKKHILNQSLSSIEEQLDPSLFFQINRSEIIQMHFIQKYQTHFKNKLAIQLHGAKELLYTSSSRTPDFRKWLGAD